MEADADKEGLVMLFLQQAHSLCGKHTVGLGFVAALSGEPFRPDNGAVAQQAAFAFFSNLWRGTHRLELMLEGDVVAKVGCLAVFIEPHVQQLAHARSEITILAEELW